MPKYTITWDVTHVLRGIEADSEKEALRVALRMADDTYYNSGNYHAVIEEV